jgi:hypothetical protein
VTAPPSAAPPAEAAPNRERPAATAPRVEPPRRRRPPPRDQGERGLRDLVGAGASQLGVSGALRGRDVNRPTEEDLETAEREVVIVRRNWRPDDRKS